MVQAQTVLLKKPQSTTQNKKIENNKKVKYYSLKTAACISVESGLPQGARYLRIITQHNIPNLNTHNQYLQVCIQLDKTSGVWLNQNQLSNWKCNVMNKEQPRPKINQTKRLCHRPCSPSPSIQVWAPCPALHSAPSMGVCTLPGKTAGTLPEKTK